MPDAPIKNQQNLLQKNALMEEDKGEGVEYPVMTKEDDVLIKRVNKFNNNF